MSKGRASAIFQALFFGVSSIGIIILTWTRPMPGAERALSTLIGGIGAFIALLKARRFLAARALAQVAVKDK